MIFKLSVRPSPLRLKLPTKDGGSITRVGAFAGFAAPVQVIRGYVAMELEIAVPIIVTVGMPLKVTLPLTWSGATKPLGMTPPKSNESAALTPAKVRFEQAHGLELSVTDTPRVQPAVLLTVTALLEHEPLVTPTNFPPLTIVGPV